MLVISCCKIVGEEQFSIISDYLGTPTHTYDNNGSLVWERELDVYGSLRKGDNEFVPFLYQGQYVDAETGLVYNRFRYYDNESGNYISQDPISILGGLNIYAYVHDSNVWTDELGLSARNNGGDAIGSGKNIGDKWLKGTNGNAGLFPADIADNLRGKTFGSFKDFREAFWKEVAANPKYSSAFSPQNIKRMENGRAPKAHKSQWDGKVGSYQLHHITPIHAGGGVFDMDNLLIVTPRFHKEVLDPNYHYDRKPPHH
ncbi:RHS repeat-associated core domain-containing protein [Chryseobacterium sp. c4a]|uniref:RHS repeat-associated core domain-containing protein n=1 Tax=Chryseobacterium sp. c4a TaxID=1573582 RepID=UPI0013580D17|nr:RHS repeat-associated core domain-containing protein [Chryseobacterium sp. c4a]